MTKIKNSTKIYLIYNIINVLVGVMYYFIIPWILNYPPDSINNKFEKEFVGLSYNYQYSIILFIVILSSTIMLRVLLKNININNKKNDVNIFEIRKRCIQIPYKIYFIQSFIPIIVLVLILAVLKLEMILILKLGILLFTATTTASLISYIFVRNIMKKILIDLPIVNLIGVENKNVKSSIKLKKTIFLQIIPMFCVSMLFTSLMGYSTLVKEKGQLMFEFYKNQLDNTFNNTSIYNAEEIKKKLRVIKYKSDKDYWFIITSKDNIITDKKIIMEKFFIKYMKEISFKYGGHIYENYGYDGQGVAVQVNTPNEKCYIGIKYEMVSDYIIIYFGMAFIILLSINSIILYYFAHSLAEDISDVTRSLKDISKGKDKLKHKLPITSNDEIGELEEAFNEFEEAEQLEHERFVDQERLASLGELVGGMAHNLKSPIMSVAGAMEAIGDLITEFDKSLDNESVTKEDYKAIAEEMNIWVGKVKEYAAYMNDVITTVKDQAVTDNSNRMSSFTINELIKRLDIIVTHMLMEHGCKLIKNLQIDGNTEIIGDVTVIIQVLNNLISNAADAYKDKKGNIDFTIKKCYNNENGFEDILFIVKDEAGGIKPEVEEKLFKQMYTTKGRNGTGLGLYISLSTIKGKFGGTIELETEYGKGSTFTVVIPEKGHKKSEVN
ncbi:MAG TPA: histidine kinase [Clostridiales bacterium]|nr:histidine kinase [Clostridiales bacterium]